MQQTGKMSFYSSRYREIHENCTDSPGDKGCLWEPLLKPEDSSLTSKTYAEPKSHQLVSVENKQSSKAKRLRYQSQDSQQSSGSLSPIIEDMDLLSRESGSTPLLSQSRRTCVGGVLPRQDRISEDWLGERQDSSESQDSTSSTDILLPAVTIVLPPSGETSRPSGGVSPCPPVQDPNVRRKPTMLRGRRMSVMHVASAVFQNPMVSSICIAHFIPSAESKVVDFKNTCYA